MDNKPWRKYKVGVPNESNGLSNFECVPFEEVAHVTHMKIAHRILEDHRIRADLVYDESKLNTERIRVIWLSPNDWSNYEGFRYGNVRFMFKWQKLIADKRYYWVESIPYRPPACRILISNENYDSLLYPYDPEQRDSPWWHDAENDIHYFNGKYNLEIMIEEDLALSRATRVDFVDHHLHQCCINPNQCPDCGLSNTDAAIRFISQLAARDVKSNVSRLFGNTHHPGHELQVVFNAIWRRCDNVDVPFDGQIEKDDRFAMYLARMAVEQAANRDSNKILSNIANLFCDKDAFLSSVTEVFSSVFGYSTEIFLDS